jgi:hypothetical protein
MKSEYNDVGGWKAWYDSRRPATEDLPLLRSFTNVRNRSEKVNPLRVGIRVFASPESERAADSSGAPQGNPKLQRYRLTIREVDPPSGNPRSMEATIDSIECNLPELGEQDLLRACTRYFELLDKLVDECEARFDITSV